MNDRKKVNELKTHVNISILFSRFNEISWIALNHYGIVYYYSTEQKINIFLCCLLVCHRNKVISQVVGQMDHICVERICFPPFVTEHHWHSIKQIFSRICMFIILYVFCSPEQKRFHGSSAVYIQIFILLAHIISIHSNETLYLHGCNRPGNVTKIVLCWSEMRKNEPNIHFRFDAVPEWSQIVLVFVETMAHN